MKTPYAVLAVSNHGEIVGGGEISLLALLEGLDRSRWAPSLSVPSDGAVAAGCRAMGLPTHVIPLPSLRWPGPAALRSVRAFRRLVRDTGTDLLHANGSRAMLYAGLAGRLEGRPVIWHIRVGDRDPLLDRVLAALARAIIANSHAVGRRLAAVAPGKVRCIHNGVDLALFSPRDPNPALRRSLDLPENGSVVVSVGRFVPFKGFDHLLEAARIVKQSQPGVHWVLVGDGELRATLQERCRSLGLEPHVHFTGWRHDVPDILALGDLFVLPSLWEHFGRVVIEAMAMAKPVVATDAGGIPEIVRHGETGLLVPPARPQALAESVLALLSAPERAAGMGLAGRRLAETEFSLRRHVQAVEVLYRELLEGTHDGL